MRFNISGFLQASSLAISIHPASLYHDMADGHGRTHCWSYGQAALLLLPVQAGLSFAVARLPTVLSEVRTFPRRDQGSTRLDPPSRRDRSRITGDSQFNPIYIRKRAI